MQNPVFFVDTVMKNKIFYAYAMFIKESGNMTAFPKQSAKRNVFFSVTRNATCYLLLNGLIYGNPFKLKVFLIKCLLMIGVSAFTNTLWIPDLTKKHPYLWFIFCLPFYSICAFKCTIYINSIEDEVAGNLLKSIGVFIVAFKGNTFGQIVEDWIMWEKRITWKVMAKRHAAMSVYQCALFSALNTMNSPKSPWDTERRMANGEIPFVFIPIKYNDESHYLSVYLVEVAMLFYFTIRATVLFI
jgi:hypothetical protein